MRYFEKCVTSGSCLHLTVQKSRLWSYQKVIRLSSLIQSKLLEIIVDYIRGEQLQRKLYFWEKMNRLFLEYRIRDWRTFYLAMSRRMNKPELADMFPTGP